MAAVKVLLRAKAHPRLPPMGMDSSMPGVCRPVGCGSEKRALGSDARASMYISSGPKGVPVNEARKWLSELPQRGNNK